MTGPRRAAFLQEKETRAWRVAANAERANLARPPEKSSACRGARRKLAASRRPGENCRIDAFLDRGSGIGINLD
jgi:hypothetical protein